MKQKVNWKHLVMMLVVALGLVIITESFFMSLSILIVLVVIDMYLMTLENKKKNKKD